MKIKLNNALETVLNPHRFMAEMVSHNKILSRRNKRDRSVNGIYILKSKLFLLLVFMCSSIIAQNNFKSLRQFETDTTTLHYNNSTSTIICFVPDNIVSHKYSFINLTGQALVGSALAVGFSILPSSVAFISALSGKSTEISQATLGILTISSYLFGSAVGVHWVAKSQNSKLSFWGTVGYSAIGGGFGAILTTILASHYTTIPAFGGIIVALCPIIGSMIYASFISDWPQEPQKISFVKNNLTQNDIFEQSKLFNIELFRIKL